MPHKNPEVRRVYQAAYNAAHRKERAAYNDAHHEEIAARQASYNASHREEIAILKVAYNTAYYTANREKLKAQHLAYAAAHREEQATYQATYKATHREEIAIYAAAHHEKGAARSATRRARKADAFIEAVDRQVVFARDQGTCGICQTEVEPANWHLDHIQPLSKGGLHSYDNVQVSHPVCNLQKGAK